jgi:hypothetical protein
VTVRAAGNAFTQPSLTITSRRYASAVFASLLITPEVISRFHLTATATFLMRLAFESPRMLGHVVRLAWQQFKVADVIVASVAILVMNNLSCAKLTPEMSFHNESMFKARSTIARDANISVPRRGSRAASSARATAISKPATLVRAVSLCMSVEGHEMTPAKLALKQLVFSPHSIPPSLSTMV